MGDTDTGTDIGININGKRLTNLRFANDIVLMGKTTEELEIMGLELLKISQKASLKANLMKTKYMSNSKRNEDLPIGGESIGKIEEYEYLGHTISFENKTEKEINKRINKSWKNY